MKKMELLINRLNLFFERYKKLFKGIKIAVLVLLISMNFSVIYLFQNLVVVLASYTSMSDREGLLSLIFYGFTTSIIFVGLFWLLIYKLVQIIIRKR